MSSALRAGRAVRPSRRRRVAARGPTLPCGRDPDGLTGWQANQAQWWLAALHGDEYRSVCDALREAAPSCRPHLRRALAAGHSAVRVLELAELLGARPAEWVRQRLRLVDEVPGEQWRLGARIDQADRTSCGAAVLLVLATCADPLLCLSLTAPRGDERGTYFEDRFNRRQRMVKRQANRLWPGMLGISPWGMAGWLGRHAPGIGPHRVRLVDDGSPVDLAAAVAEVNAALDLADPVPLLLGARVPRHYGLALGRDGEHWRVYEPSSGAVRVVPTASVLAGMLGDLLGFDRLQGVLLPSGSALSRP